MATTIFNSLNAPGVYIAESTGGPRTPELASFNTVYMIGSSASGDEFDLTPTLVTTVEDFTNQFGASLSTNSVKLYFRNDSQGKLYFVKTPIATVFEVTVADVNAGDVTLLINDTEVDVTLLGTENDADAVEKYIEAITTASSEVVAQTLAGQDANKFIIRSADPLEELTVTESSADVTVADITSANPKSWDYVYCIERSFDLVGGRNLEQGFIIAPQAFQNLTTSTERQSVGVAMENLAADKDFDWVALVDCASEQTTLSALQTEGQLYTTAQGHLAFYAPYLIDIEDQTVPASAAVAGIATRRYREQGFQEPPAGASYPVKGVKSVVKKFGQTEQGVLNPLGINLVRNLQNLGVVVWAARTRSNNQFYTFVHTRVIMNVLNGTLRGAFDYDLFSAVDGFGILFSRLQETARSVCRRLWLGKALFGATEQEAFKVVCSLVNNDLDDLNNGNVNLEVYVAPVPMLEKLLVQTIRVNIGRVQEAADAGVIQS